MKTIGSKKTSGTIGLEWMVLDSKIPEAKAVRAQLNDEIFAGVKYGVVFRFRGGSMPITMLGLVPAGESKPSSPSAAAWVALAHQNEQLVRRKSETASRKKGKKVADEVSQPADTLSSGTGDGNQDWMVIQKLSENEYWFLLVRDGVPMPTTDIVIPYDGVVQLMAEALTHPVVLFSNDQDIIDQAQGLAYRVEKKDFSEIVAGVRPGRAQIKALKGIPASVILSLIMVVLTLSLWWGYSAWQAHEARKAAQQKAQAAAAAQAAQLRKDQEAYDGAVRQAVLSALKSGMDKVNANLVAPSVPDVIGGWLELVHQTSINHAGWEVSGFECAYAEDRPECTVSLKRGTYGVNRLLLEDHPDAVLEGDQATYKIVAAESPSRQTSIAELPHAKDFTANFISELQFLHLASVTYTLSESKEMTESVKLPEPPASMFKPGATPPAVGPVQLGVATGELSLTGNSLWQLDGLAYLLSGSNLSAQGLSLAATRAETGAWTLKVAYTIRMRPEPVLPAVLDSKGQPMKVELPSEYRASPEAMAAPAGGNVQASESGPLPVEQEAQPAQDEALEPLPPPPPLDLTLPPPSQAPPPGA